MVLPNYMAVAIPDDVILMVDLVFRLYVRLVNLTWLYLKSLPPKTQLNPVSPELHDLC